MQPNDVCACMVMVVLRRKKMYFKNETNVFPALVGYVTATIWEETTWEASVKSTAEVIRFISAKHGGKKLFWVSLQAL